VLFNAGCNEQVLSKSRKIFGADPSCRFREKQEKNKNQFQTSRNHTAWSWF